MIEVFLKLFMGLMLTVHSQANTLIINTITTIWVSLVVF